MEIKNATSKTLLIYVGKRDAAEPEKELVLAPKSSTEINYERVVINEL